ncbi:MAG: nuclear transport factor 2 family protein [Amycolatopsis sp.]|jgi:hypothetical protein|uniref:nuclear transport factor 2 family protein n=1 Tax=Amycolatopsis sp. TaxID=37632 RepID=UPI00260BAD05|nr:nuclear transport factor 2 family protein [Amycolatopsis sp.]MCU1679559.1 nuclear transport factor 2 family protein [Amycolatopsis sp.]
MSSERDIQQVLARYVRAVDTRDGAGVARLYTEDATEVISYNRAGEFERLAEFSGAAAISEAVNTILPSHPPLGWAHHTTFDHIIEIDGDQATLDAQFLVYEVRGAQRPEDGWAPGVVGGQGTIAAIESGYYRIKLVRVEGEWKMTENETALDLPTAGL